MHTRTERSYDAISKTFHWLTAVLVIAAFIYGPGGPEQFVYSAKQEFQRHLHETLGVSVLGVSLLRLLWRRFATRPPQPAVAPWMNKAATIVQWTLYCLLFIVPLSAISGAWLQGHTIDLLGQISIPSLLPKYHSLGDVLADVHGWLGDLIIWVAGAHAAAGLFHHYVIRDNVLGTMLPLRKPH